MSSTLNGSMGKTQPIRYQDENGKTVSLFWYSKLPAGAEYKQRSRKQRAMADRLSQLPKQKIQLNTRQIGSTDRIVQRIANESFNPWSTHQMKLKNYAVTHGLKARPDRFESGRILVGLTDIVV
jgi:hypothetical protein